MRDYDFIHSFCSVRGVKKEYWYTAACTYNSIFATTPYDSVTAKNPVEKICLLVNHTELSQKLITAFWFGFVTGDRIESNGRTLPLF
jgi:hypothetical protein